MPPPGRPRRIFGVVLGLALLALAACVAPTTPPVADAVQRPLTYQSVAVAGDGSLPVFDRATAAVLQVLERSGTPARQLRRLSTAPFVIDHGGAQPASLTAVLRAVADLKPEPGQGCFVFLTSHGAEKAGFYLGRYDEFLTPAALDRALVRGCGAAPTVVIVSACFSGVFAAPPMTRPNRVILTAARADRASFGCEADRTYTFYDSCLVQTLGHGGPWSALGQAVRRCVGAAERKLHETASEPQVYVGAAASTLAAPSVPSP